MHRSGRRARRNRSGSIIQTIHKPDERTPDPVTRRPEPDVPSRRNGFPWAAPAPPNFASRTITGFRASTWHRARRRGLGAARPRQQERHHAQWRQNHRADAAEIGRPDYGRASDHGLRRRRSAKAAKPVVVFDTRDEAERDDTARRPSSRSSRASSSRNDGNGRTPRRSRQRTFRALIRAGNELAGNRPLPELFRFILELVDPGRERGSRRSDDARKATTGGSGESGRRAFASAPPFATACSTAAFPCWCAIRPWTMHFASAAASWSRTSAL